jgi:alpha-tubulin suppressor-like RCC1 family protein
LGLGNTTNRQFPTGIGSLTWSKIAAGASHSLAVKTDGTLWSWGSGEFGRLGLGNSTYYSSPKQVGALTTWVNIAAGTPSMAIIEE